MNAGQSASNGKNSRAKVVFPAPSILQAIHPIAERPGERRAAFHGQGQQSDTASARQIAVVT
jgi:hypothetical protein